MKRTTRTIAIIMAIILALAIVPITRANAQTNPPGWLPSTGSQPYVNRAILLNLLPDALNIHGTWRNNTTRVEFAQLGAYMYRAVTGAFPSGRMHFYDTTNRYVQMMGSVGVIEGTGRGNANPDGLVNRQEAAVMIARLGVALGRPLPAHTHNFADRANMSAWAHDAIGQMQRSGIMQGTSLSPLLFSPRDPYTRQQSVVTMVRFWDAIGMGNVSTPPVTQPPTTPAPTTPVPTTPAPTAPPAGNYGVCAHCNVALTMDALLLQMTINLSREARGLGPVFFCPTFHADPSVPWNAMFNGEPSYVPGFTVLPGAGVPTAPPASTTPPTTPAVTTPPQSGQQSSITLPNRRLTDAERQAWIDDYYAHGGPSAFELELIRLVNVERVNHGLVPVQIDPALMRAARFYTQQHADLGATTIRHNFGPYADNPNENHGASWNVAHAFGVNLTWTAGNSHRGSSIHLTTAERVVAAWMASPGHRAHVLDPGHRYAGAGGFSHHVYLVGFFYLMFAN